MKNIYRILAIAAISAFFASCDKTDPYKGANGVEGVNSFVTFDVKDSYSVSEAAGSFQIPVRLVNPKGEAFSVTVSGVDGDAINGINYSIAEPETGVLSFSATDPGREYCKLLFLCLIHVTKVLIFLHIHKYLTT